MLLDDDALTRSAVVANCAMNRERRLSGVNSYARELGFNPVDLLIARYADTGGAGWLDLCCGSGRALIGAAEHLRRAGAADRAMLIGVDLIDAFDVAPPTPQLRLTTASILDWAPGRTFDLITCVHGLHYVGDKLAMLTRAAEWLAPDGRLVADLDVASIRLEDGAPAGRRLTTALRGAGFHYDARRRRISRTGPARISLPYTYVGADDRAGANYTGQPAVDSYYRENR
jgi:SAM-dependent methyltransferase